MGRYGIDTGTLEVMLNIDRKTALFAAAVATTAVAVIAVAAEQSRHVRNRFFVRTDSQSAKVEPAPHAGTGTTTAYRYFDDVTDARVIFRKRALPKGASIGMHVLSHDEVYYIVRGRGELTVDDTKRQVGPDTAIFMHEGADVGIRQIGNEDLVLIVSYPPPTAH
jgi:mannose-6-phosphate isomerase-like protein (cupin superfamily)